MERLPRGRFDTDTAGMDTHGREKTWSGNQPMGLPRGDVQQMKVMHRGRNVQVVKNAVRYGGVRSRSPGEHYCQAFGWVEPLSPTPAKTHLCPNNAGFTVFSTPLPRPLPSPPPVSSLRPATSLPPVPSQDLSSISLPHIPSPCKRLCESADPYPLPKHICLFSP